MPLLLWLRQFLLSCGSTCAKFFCLLPELESGWWHLLSWLRQNNLGAFRSIRNRHQHVAPLRIWHRGDGSLCPPMVRLCSYHTTL